MLGPAAITGALADLGADVIKVEPPAGDYVRQMTWPIVEGVSLMHLHINRGKQSVVLDLRTEEGRRSSSTSSRRPTSSSRRCAPAASPAAGSASTQLRAVNPKIVFCTISGYGATGPYRDLASHGIAYDAWAGIFTPEIDDEGFVAMPDHVGIGIFAGPLYGALGILAGVISARDTGEGCQMELAQSDAAAAFDWYRSETYRAYERPESEVTGNKADDYERREPAIRGMRGGVRYQVYASSDGYVLFMASEQAFWKNFCEALGRAELFERWPGSQYGDHARGNREMQRELTEIFTTKSTVEWIDFGIEFNVPLAPVNTPQTLPDDPQFQDRMEWLPASQLGADQLPAARSRSADRRSRPSRKAPELGQHTDAVLRDLLGYDDARVAELRDAGALG